MILVRPSEASSENGSSNDIEMYSQGSPLRGEIIGKSIVVVEHPKTVSGKNIENLTSLLSRDPLLFIVVSKVTQVVGGLQMVATALISIRDIPGGSIEYESEKGVIDESIAVLSWKVHFCGL